MDNETTQQLSAVNTRDSAKLPASLVVIRGESLGCCYEIGDAALTIGRSAQCDIHLAENSVSRHHCQIFREGERIRLRDLGSTNRTQVNDRPVHMVDLSDGDRIGVGQTLLKFVAHGLEAEYHATLYRQAAEDGLTGIANRRTLEQALTRAVRQQAQRGRTGSLVVMDIDRFKRINDTYDHLVGDAVIRQVARLLVETAGDHLVGRLGGEEFALLLENTALDPAMALVERIRERVAARPLTVGEHAIAVTVSAGVAEWGDGRVSEKAWLRAADLALLAAKQSGRNCVCRAP